MICLHGIAEVLPYDFGNGGTIISFRQQPRNKVVDTACKNRTKGNPKEHSRSPHSTGQSTEDRAQSSDVQQLDQEDTARSHRNIVDTIFQSVCRSLSVIDRRTETTLDIAAVNEVAEN